MTTTVFVFSGSRNGDDPIYTSAAKKLAEALSDANAKLMYGGGSRGLMGALSKRALKKNVPVTGVVPKGLFDLEEPRSELETFVVTEDMHARKRTMYEGADGFVLLPGGTGSLDEFFEVLTWNHIGAHEKPIAVLNVAAYYSPLRTLLQQVQGHGFSDELFDDRLLFTSSSKDAVDFILTHPTRKRSPAPAPEAAPPSA